MEALKGMETVSEIAAKYEVHPVQVGNWKGSCSKGRARCPRGRTEGGRGAGAADRDAGAQGGPVGHGERIP